jgi:hypothetical protein
MNASDLSETIFGRGTKAIKKLSYILFLDYNNFNNCSSMFQTAPVAVRNCTSSKDPV